MRLLPCVMPEDDRNPLELDERPETFKILMVCTGNICRSAMAESLLQTWMNECSPGQFDIESAGTAALVGSPMTPQIAGLVRVFGGNPEGFASRQLTGNLLREQSLVLTMTREHRSRVLELEPSLLRRTFTVREFARIVETLNNQVGADEIPIGGSSARWAKIVSRALGMRSEVTVRQEDDEVIDPYRRNDEVHNAMVRQLIPALKTLLGFERRDSVQPE